MNIDCSKIKELRVDIVGTQRKSQEFQEEKEQLELKLKDLEEEVEKKTLQFEECVNEKKKMQLMVDEGNDEKEIIMNELRKCRSDMKGLDEQVKEKEKEVVTGKEEVLLMEEKVGDDISDLVSSKCLLVLKRGFAFRKKTWIFLKHRSLRIFM